MALQLMQEPERGIPGKTGSSPLRNSARFPAARIYPLAQGRYSMHPLIHSVLNRIALKHTPLLNEAEAITLACLPDQDTLDILAAAAAARAAFGPEAGSSCGIVNAKSGQCPENCAFCAQSAHHRGSAPVYPLLSADELLRRAEELARAGVSRFGIVTSGTALADRELDSLCAAAEHILRNVDIRLCGSLGMLTEERARRLKQAGFTRYHHNLETAASHFEAICTTHAYTEDIAGLRAARRAGLELCSCGIFGLGESREQRVELGLTLAAEGVDSLPVNFLKAIPGTPLEGTPPLPPKEALRCIALMRLLNPGKDVVVCGGREHALGQWQSWVFAAGASMIMTGNYLTTAGRAFEEDNAMLAELGLRSTKNRGARS